MKNTGEKFPGTFVKVTSTVVVAVLVCATVGILKKRNQSSAVSLNKTEMASKTKPTIVHSNTRGFVNKESFINPPIKGTDVAFKKHTINADNGGSFTYNGSKIIIPAGIFCDEKGTAIKGKVDIKYREFHNPIDMFLSGIPMTYDSAGTKFTFESAGMLDIRGEQNGKPVLIKQGKNVEVEMASTTTNENYNIYVLDTVKKNWVFQDVSKTSLTTTSTLPQLSASQLALVKSELDKLEKQKPIAPIESNPKNMSFTIQADGRLYPEIASFAKTLFEADPTDKHFDPTYRKTTWDDASLRRIGNSSNYKLTLSKDTISHTFVVYPVLDHKDYKKAQKQFNEKYNSYLTARKQLTETLDKKVDLYKRVAYAEKQEEQYAVAYQTNTFVIRRFNVNSFGFWNCDHVFYSKAAVVLNADFKDNKNDTLDGTSFYMASSKWNALFNVYPGQPIRFDTETNTLIWCITKNNKVAVFTPDDFKKINVTSGNYTFNLKVLDKKIKSQEDANAIFSKYL